MQSTMQVLKFCGALSFAFSVLNFTYADFWGSTQK